MTLNDRKGGIEVILVRGESYDLPEDNAHIKSLLAQGHLAIGIQPEVVLESAPSDEPVKKAAAKRIGRPSKKVNLNLK